jgi:tetratricopeptide (TPR) repeat protein
MKSYWTLTSLILCAVVYISSAYCDDKPKDKEEKRFDAIVREDIFAGFRGDKEALERGVKACEDAIQKDAKHAEALVWRGAARVYQAGQLMQSGKQADGIKLWTSGLKDMDDANDLKPNDISVMIPRAAVLTGAGKNAPKIIGEPLLKKALADFQGIEKKQKDSLDKIGTHSLGELRMGQADLHRALGNIDESKKQLEAVIKELPDSKYAKRAKEWLEAKADAKLNHNCIGCHTK